MFAPQTYIVVLRAHPVRGESHIQRNASGELATVFIYDFKTKKPKQCRLVHFS